MMINEQSAWGMAHSTALPISNCEIKETEIAASPLDKLGIPRNDLLSNVQLLSGYCKTKAH